MRGPSLEPPKLRTLNEVLSAAASSPEGLHFLDAQEREERLPWPEVYRRARKVAGALLARGIRAGDRVALILPTAPSFADTFFGALLAGAVPVPLYPPVRLGRIDEYHRATARMITAAGARIVVSDRRVGLLLGESTARARPPLGLVHAQTLLEDGVPDERAVHPEALGLIQFSSGSTTDPKPVALSHANLVAQCAALHQLMRDPLGPRPVGVSWLPLYHDMGLIGCLLTAAYYPGPLVLIPPEVFLARPAIWLRAISRFRGTISPAPNFAYGLCLKRVREEDVAGLDLSSWRFALNGAEPVSPEVIARFCERFGRRGFDPASLMPVYGLSEASLAVTFSPRRSPLRSVEVDAELLASERRVAPGGRAIVSVGVPIPGIELELRDEQGHQVAEGRVGRVHVRGPSVMTGYFGGAEASARVLNDGWLDTGDLGFLHGGELHLCGRAKDLVIIRGANHAPQEFEECLDAVRGVRTGCAVALGFVPEGGSEELLILAETAGDADGGLEERIRAAVLERTGIRPHTVRALAPGTLPRTSSGKLRRSEALRRHLAGELTPPSRPTPVRMALEMARSAMAYARAKLDA